jgi:FSR family fosmidomycin resistance protein-like MFS transporter
VSCTRTLVLYGSAHAAVDAACAALLFGWFVSHHGDAGAFAALAAAYGLLAFGLQPLLALTVDRRQWYRQAAATGCALTAAAMLVPGSLPILAVCIAGAGNALFHLGGGSVGLRLRPGLAAPAGIFVAPGAVGLFLGTSLGESGFSALWTGALLLGIFSVLLLVHEAPVFQPPGRPERPLGRGRLILLLLLSSVAMRSLLGLALSFPWTSAPALAPLLVLAAALGKGWGGVLADRFGWMRIAVCAPLMSMPLLMFGTASHVEKILAMFLVATTMPVALAAVSESLPREPAFAFGLTGFALLVGALPGFSHLRPLTRLRDPMVAAELVCALALCFGLRLAHLSHSPQPQHAE